MALSLCVCAETTQRLYTAVVALQRTCSLFQLSPLEEREWFQLLKQKLLPQLRDDAFLVTAVVGGTNIGKSVIFNHLAGCHVSAVSPLASETKHPVCLVPEGFTEHHDLQSIFEGFRIREWTSSDEALVDCDEHRLFWRLSDQTAENLLILDTPDIDSDAPINWQRADYIRRCADVLIAVLTQQKYNDAAVKQFFRKAAEEDKVVIVIFNQCELPDDEAYWPFWLETFCRETGVQAEYVYVAPNDRRAAEENRLPFYERNPKPQKDHSGESDNETDVPHNLSEDLSRLRFDEVKLRSLRGSLRHLADAELGLPDYLREIDRKSSRFQSAVELLSADKITRMDDWPVIPDSLLIEAVRHWWQSQREGWPRTVHGFYNRLGGAVMWPFRAAGKKLHGEQVTPMEAYRRREWSAILETVEKSYERLKILCDSGNPMLQSRLEQLLGGVSRSDLLNRLEEAHRQVDLEAELKQLVESEMQSFRDESPQFYKFLKRVDQSVAVVRPAASVVLFFTGMGPVGDAAASLAANSAFQSAVHVAGDVAGGTIAAVVGDTALSGTTSSGAGYLEAKFRKLHTAFTATRLEWLLKMLDEHLWGSFVKEIHAGASALQSEPYRQVVEMLGVLEKQLMTQQKKTNV
jgi:hypothetical protein